MQVPGQFVTDLQTKVSCSSARDLDPDVTPNPAALTQSLRLHRITFLGQQDRGATPMRYLKGAVFRMGQRVHRAVLPHRMTPGSLQTPHHLVADQVRSGFGSSCLHSIAPVMALQGSWGMLGPVCLLGWCTLLRSQNHRAYIPPTHPVSWCTSRLS